MTANPTVSVIITVHNGARRVSGCLKSLKAQAGLLPGEMEVILVDDRSSDGLEGCLAGMAFDALRIFRIDDYVEEGLSARQRALDTGISQARGEFICVLDDDGHAPQQWVRTRLNLLAKKRADGVGGPVKFRSGKGWIRLFQTVDAYYYLRICQILNRLGMNSGILFGNFAFRRSIYHRVGGFRATGLSLTEDLVFARRLRALGHRLVFDFDNVVEVSACRSLGELIERAKRVSFSGGISVLATVLGCWMITLPLLIIGALSWLPCLSSILAARYGSGVFFAACSVLKAGDPKAVCMALVYEPLAILIGFAAFLKRLSSRQIEWGGVRYEI